MANSYDVAVRADTGFAERDLQNFNRELRNVGSTAATSGRSLDNTNRRFTGLKTAVTALIGSAAVGGFVALTRSVTESTRAMQQAADVMKVTKNEAEGIVFAFSQFGLEGDKAKDTFKDLSERLGEFLSTGKGPFEDYVAAMKLTTGQGKALAEQLRKMAGPDALQYLVDQMEAAGKSSEEMGFVLESLASDTSLLIPALRNGGEEFNRLRKRIDDLGKPSNESLQVFKTLAEDTDVAKTAFSNFLTEALAPVASTFSEAGKSAANFFSEMTKGLRIFKEQSKAEEEVDKIIGRRTNSRGRSTGVANKEAAAVKRLVEANKELAKELEKVEKVNPDRRIGGQGSQGKNTQAARDARRKQKEERIAAIKEEIAENEKLIEQESKKNEGAKKTLEILTGVKETVKEINNEVSSSGEGGKPKPIVVIPEAEDVAEFQRSISDVLKDLRQEREYLELGNDERERRMRLDKIIAEIGPKAYEANKEAIEKELDAIKRLEDQQEAAKKAQRERAQEMAEMARQIEDAHADLGQAAGEWATNEEGAWKKVIAQLIRYIALRQFGGLGSFGEGFLGGVSGTRQYANGGNFSAGTPMLVGERGPEVIMPMTNGTVIPNERLGGATSININIGGNIYGDQALQSTLMESEQRMARIINDNNRYLARGGYR